MEKIHKDETSVTHRLQCSCLSPEEAQDFTLELFKPCLMIEGRYVRHDWRNWREKLRDAWTILTGGTAYMDGFRFRDEDLREVGELFLIAADHYDKLKAEEKGK